MHNSRHWVLFKQKSQELLAPGKTIPGTTWLMAYCLFASPPRLKDLIDYVNQPSDIHCGEKKYMYLYWRPVSQGRHDYVQSACSHGGYSACAYCTVDCVVDTCWETSTSGIAFAGWSYFKKHLESQACCSSMYNFETDVDYLSVFTQHQMCILVVSSRPSECGKYHKFWSRGGCATSLLQDVIFFMLWSEI